MKTPIAECIDEDTFYPDTDGKPMAENTLQFEWIVAIKGGLDAQFRDDRKVFVAGDLFWYPVQGRRDLRTAPDVMVAFGRPKGHRRSYLQWREGGIAPQVVFEVLSPGNTNREMDGKFEFYEQYGVEEYYLYDPNFYDPENVQLKGFLRVDGTLQAIEQMHGWVSPRLQIRFDMSGQTLVLWHPNNERFLTFEEVSAEREQARQHAERMQQQAKQDRQRVKKERQKAEQERQKAEQERQLRTQAQDRAEKLAARLRELGIDPDQ